VLFNKLHISLVKQCGNVEIGSLFPVLESGIRLYSAFSIHGPEFFVR